MTKQENVRYLSNGMKVSWKGDKPLFNVNALQTKIWQEKKLAKTINKSKVS